VYDAETEWPADFRPPSSAKNVDGSASRRR